MWGNSSTLDVSHGGGSTESANRQTDRKTKAAGLKPGAALRPQERKASQQEVVTKGGAAVTVAQGAAALRRSKGIEKKG